MANRFNWIRFQHVGRDGNNVAHNLARYARHVTGFSVDRGCSSPLFCCLSVKHAFILIKFKVFFLKKKNHKKNKHNKKNIYIYIYIAIIIIIITTTIIQRNVLHNPINELL